MPAPKHDRLVRDHLAGLAVSVGEVEPLDHALGQKMVVDVRVDRQDVVARGVALRIDVVGKSLHPIASLDDIFVGVGDASG